MPSSLSADEIVKETSVINNITKEKGYTNQDLNSFDQHFREVVESAANAIIFVDDSGKIIFWNNAAEKKDPYTAGHQRRVAQLACAS